MSSIITDFLDCPQCGLPAIKEDFYVIGEERVICNWCGYNHLKTTSGTKSSKGHGTIHYVPKSEDTNGSNQSERIVRLKTPLSIVDRHKIIMDIQENYDVDTSSFYVWNDTAREIECLIGNKPKTMEEEYQEQRQEADYYRQVAFNSVLDTEYTEF